MTKKELEELQELYDMEFDEETEKSNFDIAGLVRKLWEKRRYYYISIPISAVVALLISLSIPKTYTVEVKLAPELSASGMSGGGLSSLMKNFGLGRSSSSGDGDAILPNLYPDLMNSQLFLTSLFDLPVVSRNGKINTTYYDYLDKYQKTTWWSKVIGLCMSLIPKFETEDEVAEAPKTNHTALNDSTISKRKFNPQALNKRQSRIAKAIARNIVCDVDKKTYVITICVAAQDPLICATVADSTCQRLQDFITEYRTKKARIEYDHILEQYEVARKEYEQAKEDVAAFNDANWDIVDDEFVIEKQALQNEMQLRFSAFSTMNTQLLAARAKLDEARPCFTVLDGATVPLKPTGPKKKKIIIVFVFLVCLIQTAWLLRKEIFKKKEEEEAGVEVQEVNKNEK